MSVKISATYIGEKRCEVVHGPSGSTFLTDAPVDNQGKGEFFSPTDLIGASWGSCVLTIMGIAAEAEGIDLKGASVEVEKKMRENPRRIDSLKAVIHMPKGIPLKKREKYDSIVRHCPVHRSLSPEVSLSVDLIYPD